MIVAVTADYILDPEAELRALLPDVEVRGNPGGRALERAALLELVRGASAVIAYGADRIDDEFLDAAGPQLRVVANAAVGVDNIDLAAASSRGVVVTNTPDPVREPTADMAWLLLLAASRRFVEGSDLVRSGAWDGFWPTQLLGHRVLGGTLLVVGAGRIGTSVIRRASGWDMEVLYVARSDKPEIEAAPTSARRVSLEEGLAHADFVVLTVPLTAETYHLLDARRLGLMKPSAVLVNVARGPVVDEAALVEALAQRRIFAAGLDVYENEPVLHPGLRELPNVVLMPHLGSATEEDRVDVVRTCVRNIHAVLSGGSPPDQVT